MHLRASISSDFPLASVQLVSLNELCCKLNSLQSFKAKDLRVIPVGLVQDFHDNFSLVYESVVAQLLANPFEDLCKSPLTETLHLEDKSLLQASVKKTNISSKCSRLFRQLEEIQTYGSIKGDKLTNSRSSFLIL